jgi:DNA repair protein SbcD/Mre11
MSEVRFVHTADLHLDTPFRGLTGWNPQLSKKLKDATFRSFRMITDLCLERKVDFLIISGDIFDSINKSLAAQLKFFSELKRLSDHGISAYFVCGNHDPFDSWLGILNLPEKVYRFDPDKCEYMTFRRGEKAIADIHGISFREAAVRQNLAMNFSLPAKPSPISIGVLHGTVGLSGPHEKYAPFSIEDIADKGFDYWALGHIHKSQIIRNSNPTVVYPGNPQGRDFGETGIKGCYLVNIRTDHEPELEFIPTQLIRFENAEIDLTGAERIEQLEEKIREAMENIAGFKTKTNLILRICLKGRTSLHDQLCKPDEIQKLLEHFNDGQLTQDYFVWIDSMQSDTRPDFDLENIRNGAGFPAEILRVFDLYEGDRDKLKELILSVEKEFVNSQVKKYAGELPEEAYIQLLERAKTILLDQILQER